MLQIPHSSDHFWMQRALSLANTMRGHVWPNPPVGCVIVKKGAVVAEAATGTGGRPHAERKALVEAAGAAKGATLYVTLEPCCHWDKTPPCADAVIDAGIRRVVVAIQDPDPRVNGGGFVKLREAGLDVVVGVGAVEARRLMSGFFHRVQKGEPELVVLEKSETSIPPGVDALIRSTPSGTKLVTRLEPIDVSDVPHSQFLQHLGALGLTSVAVSAGDPICSVLEKRGTSVENTNEPARRLAALVD